MGWSSHHPVGLIHYSPGRCHAGYTLISTGGDSNAYLLDMEGRVCHMWSSPEAIGNSYLLRNCNLLLPTNSPTDIGPEGNIGGSSSMLQELDCGSNVVWELRNPMVHHHFRRLPNGNTLAVLFERMPADASPKVQGGLPPPRILSGW